MQELQFKNLLATVVIFIIAAAACIGASYININAINLPLPLLTIGLFAGFIILSFICYPKATTGQTLQITITGVFINAILLALSIIAIKQMHFTVDVSADFILTINPLIPALSFVFSFITLITTIRFGTPAEKPEKLTIIKEDTKEDIQKDEKISFNTDNKEPSSPVIEEKPKKEEPKTEIKSEYEELYPQAKSNVPAKPQETNQSEFLLNFGEEKSSSPEKKVEKEEFFALNELPSLALNEEKEEVAEPAAEIFIENKQETQSNQEVQEENFDYIPTDIRLIETPLSKEKDSKGKIASIGKLLVNNRDIEGVIEAGTIINSEHKTSVVSSESGEQIHEKFNQITQQFSQIKEIALIDKGGFVMACNCSDKMKINITGALIAGAYHTLQNYLMQINFTNPEKIFFETQDANNFIIKTGNELLFSIWDREFKHIDLGELQEFLESEEISAADFNPLIDLGQIKSFSMSNAEGKVIFSSENEETANKQAVISAAVFENLKVFLMNIQLLKLSRITILNKEETLVIQKNNDNIISFKTQSNEIIKICGELKKLEEIY